MALQTILELFSTKILPLLLSAIGFGLLIVVHELGHFLFCKLFNIHTPTFSIGFGPKLFERRIGATNFRIAQIPFGGYVEIAGIAEPGQGEQQFASDRGESSFASKPYWQKFLVMMGGIIFNLTFAYIAFVGLYMVGDHRAPKNVTISDVAPNSAAQRSGLQAGDQILAINNSSFENQPELSLEDKHGKILALIRENPSQEVYITVLRGQDQYLDIAVTLDAREIAGKQAIGSLGAYFSPVIEKLPFLRAIKTGIIKTNFWITFIASSLKNLFASRSLEGAGGPVMILAQGFKTAQQGLFSLFVFLALMSINLALFNLLPLGITDGGVLLIATIEAIIRRQVPDMFRIGLNVVSWGLFAVFALYLTYKDILALFGSTISKIGAAIMGLLP